MTKHKHTPGPWRHEGPDYFHDFNILHPGDSLAVAAVVSNMRQLPEIEANAKLIAAAPELLESLSNLVGLARLGAANISKYHAALAHAESVIAKASA
ncbi:hypothetical protein PSCICO_31650 [Pseudomonas cichorii]|uniref:hypothetical protein n=1 Tax=Pseudomonas cichorii TaxID=36746 RepID=UPI001910F97A|nr:hypothetical protein [Pseudomonas cichorii]GFM87766.1 hypothetical protein PSCICO_31650 [Pseudomonas cichorii]